MCVSFELMRRLGFHDGRQNQLREYLGQAFLIEEEALQDRLARPGMPGDHLCPGALEAYRLGYGEGADQIQREEPAGPFKQPDLWRFQRTFSQIVVRR